MCEKRKRVEIDAGVTGRLDHGNTAPDRKTNLFLHRRMELDQNVWLIGAGKKVLRSLE